MPRQHGSSSRFLLRRLTRQNSFKPLSEGLGARRRWDYLLSRSIGVTRAANNSAMTGEALTAEKALEWRVVYRVCEVDKLETREQVLKI